MVSKGSSNEQNTQINATTILALLTLLGGVIVATHQLSSDRPVVPPGEANPEISQEKVNTRLWEDPLARAPEVQCTNKSLIGNLAGELGDPQNSDFQLLAVMTPGGPASEDRERRIRDRFAIVSALAESAYAPRHNSQIGIGMMPWPTSLELSSNISATAIDTAATKDAIAKFVSKAFTNKMYFAFEWYDREDFLEHRAGRSLRTDPVLLVWLDEDQFSDYPIPRLDMFFHNLGDTNLELPDGNGPEPKKDGGYTHYPATNYDWTTNNGTDHPLALIGPGRSDTLKAMFAHEFKYSDKAPPDNDRSLGNGRTNTTSKVSLFLASPAAADDVLVASTNHFDTNMPRKVLLEKLGHFFHAATNYAVTDPELARGVIAELASRGVDLTNTKGSHLVLIGGWDEYHGRMLSEAYAAELARNKWVSNCNPGTFYTNYFNGTISGPTNLHTFLYLSGLDGQGLSQESKYRPSHNKESTTATGEDAESAKPSRWTPDENRAEGPAQYDYLGRLAKRICDLNNDLLRSDDNGCVKAIVIGGGDVYDTLLILQALRPRFPEAIFVATSLDARFWDPKEWPWSRNLVVVSGYGLALNGEFQSQTAPFRDSWQTAMYAAALAALGNTNLPELKNDFPVRRFEIGRYGPVALNTANVGVEHRLHPDPNPRDGAKGWFMEESRLLCISMVVVSLALMILALSRNFRVSKYQFLSKPLWLREEDIGGLDGFAKIGKKLASGPLALKNDRLPPLIAQLREVIKNKNPDEEMDPLLQEQGSVAIFTQADILDPEALVKKLMNQDDGLAKFVYDELPLDVRVSLKTWYKTGDRPALLADLAGGLRGAIRTMDLSKWRTNTSVEHDKPKARWRINREVLSDKFKGVLRPPLSVAPFLSKQEGDDWQKEWREVLKDPVRCDFMQTLMLRVLQDWNSRWVTMREKSGVSGKLQTLIRALLWGTKPKKSSDAIKSETHGTETQGDEKGRLSLTISLPRRKEDLKVLRDYRKDTDELITELLTDGGSPSQNSEHDKGKAMPDGAGAVAAAHRATESMYELCVSHWKSVWIIIAVAAVFGIFMFCYELQDTWFQPWELSGASIWPTNWIYVLAVTAGLLFIFQSYFRLRTVSFEATRECRLKHYESGVGNAKSTPRSASLRDFFPARSEPVAVVDADDSWQKYQSQGRGYYRFCRSFFLALLYFILFEAVFHLAFGHSYQNTVRRPGGTWYICLSGIAFCLFLFLSFWTLDAAFLCRRFIIRITQGPTLYSLATQQHFSRKRGQVPFHVLSEWIDVSVIAEITERVGMLIYFPAGLFFLIILANDPLFYYFPWPPIYYVMAFCNFGVSAASIVVLQRAARKARAQSMEVLAQKLNQLKSSAAATQAEKKQHDVNETEALLEEIGSLKKGAFGGFWQNPVVGALLVPSGGTALIEIIRYFVK